MNALRSYGNAVARQNIKCILKVITLLVSNTARKGLDNADSTSKGLSLRVSRFSIFLHKVPFPFSHSYLLFNSTFFSDCLLLNMSPRKRSCSPKPSVADSELVFSRSHRSGSFREYPCHFCSCWVADFAISVHSRRSFVRGCRSF